MNNTRKNIGGERLRWGGRPRLGKSLGWFRDGVSSGRMRDVEVRNRGKPVEPYLN
jgi:hypothetical protein